MKRRAHRRGRSRRRQNLNEGSFESTGALITLLGVLRQRSIDNSNEAIRQVSANGPQRLARCALIRAARDFCSCATFNGIRSGDQVIEKNTQTVDIRSDRTAATLEYFGRNV